MNEQLEIATKFANLLDNSFNLFGIKFGISAVFDLIPGLGDTIDLLLSLYIVWLGIRMSVPTIKVLEMVFNITINYLIGLIPILGDAVYLLRKVNLKNLELIRKNATVLK